MSVVGFSAYAVSLNVTNGSSEDLAVECFPSGYYCNGVGINGKWCTCPDTDTSLYFGRFGAPQLQTDLDAITTNMVGVVNGATTPSWRMGNGHVWKVIEDINDTGTDNQECFVQGIPSDMVSCEFSE